MRAKRIPFDQQLQLIMECRKSGLSDYQWCQEHDINPGTFYNWVKRHRQKACEDDIPPSVADSHSCSPTALMQEVVRIDPGQLAPGPMEPPVPTEEKPAFLPTQTSSPALEIELNGAILRISNDVSPGLLSQTLRLLRGMPC